MYNVFDIIKNHIRINDTPTYGDLLNENKNEVKKNAIRRLCTTDEYEEYKELYNFDKKRLIDESYTELKDNYLMPSGQNKEIYVPCIGLVKQIC